MSLVVQKFGGTSVANAKLIFNVANIITRAYQEGNDVVVVVSAQGDMTDELIEKANEINANASKREMDVLMASGEQISVALLAMAIERLGFPVTSLLGWQAGVMTSSTYGSAMITRIDPGRIKKELDKKNIVIVAGFQGLSQYYDVTTLGRGGSDTSAVGIAVALSADLCQIYTDVEGVYTADPRLIAKAKKLDAISYDEMLELATLGAQVLNNRSVEIAKKHNVELEVLSSFVDVPGTIVREAANVEKMLISGVAKDDKVAKISITGIPDSQGWIFRIFSKLSARDINVDTLLQTAVHGDRRDIFFTVKEDRLDDTIEALSKFCESIEGASLTYDKNVSKVSIVGAGMQTHAGVAAKMFEALFTANIDIQMIATSEIKVSVIVARELADEAVRTVHNAFFTTMD
ncbi:MAG: aspartate kinase [Bacteroidales bacterium]|nr:aspartate kinase [Bacteroidales bacterium]